MHNSRAVAPITSPSIAQSSAVLHVLLHVPKMTQTSTSCPNGFFYNSSTFEQNECLLETTIAITAIENCTWHKLLNVLYASCYYLQPIIRWTCVITLRGQCHPMRATSPVQATLPYLMRPWQPVSSATVRSAPCRLMLLSSYDWSTFWAPNRFDLFAWTCERKLENWSLSIED